jgi:hypothetical protein
VSTSMTWGGISVRGPTASAAWSVVLRVLTRTWRECAGTCASACPPDRGLHSSTSELKLRTFGNTSLTLQLNPSTSGPHPRVELGHVGDKVSLR